MTTVGQGLLIVEVSKSYSHTPHSVELLWMSDQPAAETSTWQHTQFSQERERERLSCPWRDSYPHSHRAKYVDPRLRPCGHWVRHLLIHQSNTTSHHQSLFTNNRSRIFSRTLKSNFSTGRELLHSQHKKFQSKINLQLTWLELDTTYSVLAALSTTNNTQERKLNTSFLDICLKIVNTSFTIIATLCFTFTVLVTTI